jgi:hypothetical protein
MTSNFFTGHISNLLCYFAQKQLHNLCDTPRTGKRAIKDN